MRHPAIPKLSKLSTAGRAELLAIWTATIAKPPKFRASRELLASALAWQLQERKFGGLNPPLSVSCAFWRAPWSGRSAQCHCRSRPSIFAPGPRS